MRRLLSGTVGAVLVFAGGVLGLMPGGAEAQVTRRVENYGVDISPMKKPYVVFLFALALCAGTISAAYAECYKNGVAYPTGTISDGFICTPDGRWVKL